MKSKTTSSKVYENKNIQGTSILCLIPRTTVTSLSALKIHAARRIL